MQNFGKIKNAFNGILAEGVVSKNDTNKLLFKKYIKTLKESDILKTQFLVYNNIENKIEENEFKATEFVKANIELMSKFNRKDISEANLKLATDALFVQGKGDYDLEKLHENISTLIFTKRTPSTVDTIIEATSNIVNYIKTNKKKEDSDGNELPNSMITPILVDKYNAKYASLDESEKKVLKSLIDSTAEEKNQVYSETLRECIELVNASLKTESIRTNPETYEKLLNVKDKLLNDTHDISENFEQKISKLVELRSNLISD